MSGEQRLIARFREDLGHSPIVSNVVFGLGLAVVEKIVEVEFACPCNSQWNIVFSAAFFIIPAFIAFLMMMMIHDFKSQNPPPKWAYSFLPPLIWQVLIFLDGQYFVCAVSYWPGTFVSVEQTFLKWCTPTNTTRYSSEELMAYSHRMFVISQGIGFGLLMAIIIFLFLYTLSKCCRRRS